MSPIVEELLRKRGIGDFEKFLNPSLADLVAPRELPGIVEASGVILDKLAAGEKIVVFGDYDCDGVCATAILVKTLTALAGGAEGRIEAFLPDRLSEGYGMSDGSIARMLKESPEVSLVVTVDNGINSVSQIAALKAKGIAVVVTDHHLPGEKMPPADAIVNPKVASPESLADFCGAAVAFLLANELVSEAKRSGLYTGVNIGGPLLVLAGLATVTDIMPVLGQNRILVAEALKRFRSWAPLGLKELHSRAARSGYEKLTSKDFGFLLGPRINAAGRLASGMESLELILSEDREIAREAARLVDLHNTERKAVEQKMTEEALAKVVEGASAQVIHLPAGHPGVAGIVAARVLERLGNTVPVCVLAGGHGSARAPDHINIRDAFVACQETLSAYGGHAAAGGFSVKPGMIDRFREMLCDYCERFRGEGEAIAAKASEPELWIEPGEVSLALAEEVMTMEPFGEANPEPVFGFRNARVTDVKPLGDNGRHLTLTVNGIRAVFWGHGDMIEKIRSAGSPDVLFALVISDYQERHVELRVLGVNQR